MSLSGTSTPDSRIVTPSATSKDLKNAIQHIRRLHSEKRRWGLIYDVLSAEIDKLRQGRRAAHVASVSKAKERDAQLLALGVSSVDEAFARFAEHVNRGQIPANASVHVRDVDGQFHEIYASVLLELADGYRRSRQSATGSPEDGR